MPDGRDVLIAELELEITKLRERIIELEKMVKVLQEVRSKL